MIRIYLDSNIFRFIKKAETDFYRRLDDDLRKYSNQLIYYFSYAHLSDLTRDKSDKKKEDLEFMEEFVGSNYLSLGWKEEFVNVQFSTPSEAFFGIDTISLADAFNFDDLFEEFSLENLPEIVAAKIKLDELMSSQLNLGLATSIETFSAEGRRAAHILFPLAKDVYTVEEWFGQCFAMYDNLLNDPKLYRELRRLSLENLSLAQKYNIDIEKFDFNEELKNTPLQQSFYEFVNKSIENSSNLVQREYEFFNSAYNSLNILGIDKESNRKAKFANTLNDALHAYYAGHCDYLVSDDDGMLLKAKVLYRLLGIETKVLHVKEFAEQIGSIAGIFKDSVDSFFKMLRYDLKYGLIINTKASLRYNRICKTIKPSQTYFSYFDLLDYIEDKIDGNIIVLYRGTRNYSKFISFKEFEGVVNKIVKIFGVDINLREEYSESDTNEIISGEWKGRVWTFGSSSFQLEINSGTGRFSFLFFES